jgi:CSLREA domain-containing protein
MKLMKLGVYCALFLSSFVPLQAATLTVNSTGDSTDGTCDATNCTLREAIIAANIAPDADTISFSIAGAGPRQIMLHSGLPDVQSDLAINGFSDPAMLIIQRAVDSAEFGLLTIGSQRTVSIEGLTLSGGKAEAGGAVHNSGALTMRRCIVKNNRASNGGGLQHWMGTILLEECSFFDNIADNDGGGASLFAPFTLRFCTFNNNEAAQYGGGLSVSSAAGAVRVCTISGNRARRGGGIFSVNGTTNYLNLRNSTIAYNEAFDGGGLCFRYNGITTLSTIFAYNSGGDVKHASDAQPTTILSWGSNLTSDSAPALERPFGAPHDLQNTDPLLLPLANNGGWTAMHAFRPDSPAKEKGWRTQERDGTPAETTDQRGVTRPIDDPNVPNAVAQQSTSPYTSTVVYGDGTDIGAYELSPTTISIGDITMNERDNSTTQALFQVALSQRFPVDVTVQYSTVYGSAVEGSDYHATSGVLTIPAGDISAYISVPIVGDVLDESNEYFGINLSQAINATIADSQGIGTIVDNDTTPLIINDVNVVEGNPAQGAPGTTEAEFTVSLSAPNPQTVTVQCRTADGIARASSDYEALAPITLTFAPGEVSKTFSVPIVGDLLDEANENFFVILSAPVNATIGRGRGIGTITDDDATPGITVDDISIGEGNSGQRVAAFRLKLSAPSGQAVRVNAITSGGTATAGNDYVALSSMPIAFNVGSQYAYARVFINGDVLNEKDETFLVNLSTPVNATLVDNQALGTILNDDRAPSLTINDAQIAEGDNGAKELSFTVTLSAASGQIVSVNYTTANGIARSTSDYAATSGTLNFVPGILTQTITVSINGDKLVEGDETLYVILSNAVNASVGRGRGMGTLLNDDSSG